ncbi:MAG TPA: valine--tRNA ligase [Candidatus Saccharimonadales bacterium]|nr:valine--tRNA ligase [Candidatus Saccharimonadales bacterium]
MKLAKTYDPQAYEPRIYTLWEQSNAFAPKGDPKKGYFSIAMPPPNANGNLHVGHALTIAIEDAAVRYHRLKGVSTTFLPGADHAGFETWVVFEKGLELQGKTRFTFSRDSLYQMVWDFVEQQRGNMEIQLRELGASTDWNNLTFTLDAKVVHTAYDTFKKLWDDGLIYRGERIVNYCTKHQTSFADIEVEHRQEKSKLWSIAYTLVDKIGEVVVATTRPETLLGDTAIAVHPNDERYKHLIGHRVWVPLTNREIPIVGDEAIDPTFGTGAVKVTPAHDPTDFEIGERHNLPIVEVIGMDGKMTGECPPEFAGLEIKEARDKILTALKTQDQLRGEQDYVHSVGHCYKCGTAIQPLIKDQWFLKVKPLAEQAIKAIEAGDITFVPANKGKVLVNYLKNLKDWNLSRQIPWGIPIPAFQSSNDHTDWVFDTRVDQKTIDLNGVTYHREEDTFDTWFSSGQWPFITTDYLQGGALADYYPLSVMETGGDILFPWVSRMIMLGLYRTGKVPFKQVYLHGLVLDEHGLKMSKSKGNVLNPQEMVKEYGSDALRMGLLANRSAGVNQAFSTATIIAGRNFCNKLWNMARFIESKLGNDYKDRAPQPKTSADHWVLKQLNTASAQIGTLIESHRYAEACELAYHTIWDDVADWYIEASKSNVNPSVLAYTLETILTIAHPFAPFVTETIWQTLQWEKSLLIHSSWPKQATYSPSKAKEFEQLKQLITEVRFVIASLGKGKQTLLYTNDALIHDNQTLIAQLANTKAVQQVGEGRGMRLAVAKHQAWLDINAGTLQEHQAKLQARLTEVQKGIELLQNRLTNKDYVGRAPAHIVEQTRSQLAEQQAIEQQLARELEVIKPT